jgi:uncharacterized membrane protein
MNLVLLSIIAMVFYSIGEVLSKKYANTGSINFGILAVLAYTIVSTIWLLALRIKNSVAILGTMWDLFYIIIGIFVGLIVFREQLNVYNYIGLVLSIVAFILLCK